LIMVAKVLSNDEAVMSGTVAVALGEDVATA
jgi:hypothetical protein